MVQRKEEEMKEHEVRTPEQALVYITNCCLATVESLAMLKSKSKYEYKRQISIAQKACTWIEQMNIDHKGTRAEAIVRKQTVEEWARFYEQES